MHSSYIRKLILGLYPKGIRKCKKKHTTTIIFLLRKLLREVKTFIELPKLDDTQIQVRE